MKQLVAAVISFFIEKTPNFRGKVRLLRLLGFFCNGAYIKTKFGVLMQADFNDDTNIFAMLGLYKSVPNEIRKIKKGEAFIDIGANAGLFSLMAGQCVGPEGIILAFEPQKPLFFKLVNNAKINNLSNIFCFNLALSNSTKMVGMSDIDVRHTGIASINETTIKTDSMVWAVNPSSDLKTIQRMLDNRETTIKIDVEGHELNVLKGISWLFDSGNINKLIVEIDAANLRKFGSEVSDIYSFMERHGFTPIESDTEVTHFDEIFVRQR